MAVSVAQQLQDSTDHIDLDALSSHYSSQTLAEKYIEQFGNDALCYLSFGIGKKYFFGWKTEGFLAYVVIKRVVICLGDPICELGQMKAFIMEFQQFCNSNKWRICFSSINETTLSVFAELGFHSMKYGEEAVIELPDYELVGKQTIKLRNKIHQADKNGMRVIEYRPTEQRNYELERKIDRVSAEWFADKNAQLTFSLGDLHLEDPLQRRYFVSYDKDQSVHAVLMFSPYRQGKAYFLDVMRRKKQETMPGVMEHAIISAAMQMKAEGVEEVSLGMVPLVGIESEVRSKVLQKIAKFVFCHVKSEYGFESLYLYKKKFSPTKWKARYVAYDKQIPLFKVWVVMMKARNVRGAFQQLARGVWSLLKIRPKKKK